MCTFSHLFLCSWCYFCTLHFAILHHFSIASQKLTQLNHILLHCEIMHGAYVHCPVSICWIYLFLLRVIYFFSAHLSMVKCPSSV